MRFRQTLRGAVASLIEASECARVRCPACGTEHGIPADVAFELAKELLARAGVPEKDVEESVRSVAEEVKVMSAHAARVSDLLSAVSKRVGEVLESAKRELALGGAASEDVREFDEALKRSLLLATSEAVKRARAAAKLYEDLAALAKSKLVYAVRRPLRERREVAKKVERMAKELLESSQLASSPSEAARWLDGALATERRIRDLLLQL